MNRRNQRKIFLESQVFGVTLLMEMKEQNSKLIGGNGFWSHNYGLYTTDEDEVARLKTIAHHTKPSICTSFRIAININFAYKNNTVVRV